MASWGRRCRHTPVTTTSMMTGREGRATAIKPETEEDDGRQDSIVLSCGSSRDPLSWILTRNFGTEPKASTRSSKPHILKTKLLLFPQQPTPLAASCPTASTRRPRKPAYIGSGLDD